MNFNKITYFFSIQQDMGLFGWKSKNVDDSGLFARFLTTDWCKSKIMIKYYLTSVLLLTLGLFSGATAQGTLTNCGCTGTMFINEGNCGSAASTPLKNASGLQVGTVDIEMSGTDLLVTYTITEPDYVILETHLDVSSTESGLLINATNDPAIGSYSNHNFHNNVTTYTYTIPGFSGSNEVYIAARAVVHTVTGGIVDISAVEASFPTNIYYELIVDLTETPYYFEISLDGTGIFSGQYFGNCIDLSRPIYSGDAYYVNLVSSYHSDVDLLACIVDKPENLDLLNYLINHTQDYFTNLGATGKEMQAAAWTLIDDDTPIQGAGGITWDDTILQDILDDVYANGEGYVPGCGGLVAMLLDLGCTYYGVNAGSLIEYQQTMAYLPIVSVPGACTPTIDGGTCATYWGAGKDFGGTSCASYFKFCINE